MRTFMLLWLGCLALLTGCVAGGQSFPTYRYVGIDLGATPTGQIFSDGECLRLQLPVEDTGEPMPILVLPEGTRLADGVLTLPARNGGDRIALGETVTLQGGYNEIAADSGERCTGTSFIVNRVYRPDN